MNNYFCSNRKPMDEINQAYIRALTVCKRAIDNGKSHVALQSTRDGSYRLAAVGLGYSGDTSYRFDMLLTDWAQNVVCRLREVCLLSVTVDDIDEYFAKEMNDLPTMCNCQ